MDKSTTTTVTATSTAKGWHRRLRTGTLATLAIATVTLLLAGCGSGSSITQASQPATTTASAQASTSSTSTPPAKTETSTSTPTKTASAPKPAAPAPVFEKVELSSPAIKPEEAIPARYTCDGQDTPPPFRWQGIPPGTKELMLDVIKIAPVDNKLSFAWALTGLKPTTHGIVGGKRPPGTIVGANGEGQSAYHLCPPKGPSEKYVAVLFALAHPIAAKTGFDAAKLRLEAEHNAKYQGFLIFTYQRK